MGERPVLVLIVRGPYNVDTSCVCAPRRRSLPMMPGEGDRNTAAQLQLDPSKLPISQRAFEVGRAGRIARNYPDSTAEDYQLFADEVPLLGERLGVHLGWTANLVYEYARAAKGLARHWRPSERQAK